MSEQIITPATAPAPKVITRDLYTDLSALFDILISHRLHVTDIAEMTTHNTRYVRELLGLLSPLVSEDADSQWAADHWDTDDEASAAFEATFRYEDQPKDAPTPPRPAKVTNASGKCLCGCGAASKSNYRPGHDARHAGQVARWIATHQDERDATSTLALLPTPALQRKASAMADRLIAKANAKVAPSADTTAHASEAAIEAAISAGEAAKAADEVGLDGEEVAAEVVKEQVEEITEAHYEDGKIKIGRFVFAARRHVESGQIVVNENRAGNGAWHDATPDEAAKFKAV